MTMDAAGAVPGRVDVTFKLIVPETVPVWRPMSLAVKTAAVERAGTVKVTVRPPVENWMAGSSIGLAELGWNVSVTWPVMVWVDGAERRSPNMICCPEVDDCGTPVKLRVGLGPAAF